MTDAKAVAAEVLAALRERSDPDRLETARKLIPTAMEVLGVRTPELRVVVGRLALVLRGAPADHVLALAQVLVDGGTLEGRQAGYELVERHGGAREALTRESLEALGRGMDNRALVDGFSVMLAGVAWREGRIGDDTIDSYRPGQNLLGGI